MKTAQVYIHKVFVTLYRVQAVFASISLLLLALMIFLQVILRYILKSPLFGIEEAETFPMIWVYFIGGAMASYERTHIQCGIASVLCKNDKVLYWVDLVKGLFSTGLSLLLTYWMYDFAIYSFHKGQVSALLNIPMILTQGTFFVSMLLVTVFCIRDVLDVQGRKNRFLGGAQSCN